MKLFAAKYISPILTEGIFENAFIEETSIQLQREYMCLKIDFDLYIVKDNVKIILASSYIVFEGMNDGINSNRKTTFKFNDSEDVKGLVDYLITNQGQYPINYKILDWGHASYEDSLTYFSGGNFFSPELQPANNFVKDWILNTVTMKGEKIGNQFQFVD
jgi:hypothetical protein